MLRKRTKKGCQLLLDLAKRIANRFGFEVRRKPDVSSGSWQAARGASYPEKASASDRGGRFREILSDPLNVLIERDPMAGVVSNGLVKLHTGAMVPVSGSGTYYEGFSDILVFNRGVHEPLEEFAFQEVIKRIDVSPVMLELGAYWGHYSMWLKKLRPSAEVYLVEPDKVNLKAGVDNFNRNSLNGTFINALVGRGHFEVDLFLEERKIDRLNILHADIQGYEVEMLEGCGRSFARSAISYCFISTHSQQLHSEVISRLRSVGFRIEVSADFEHETTSFDGLVFASHASLPAVLEKFDYLGREQIAKSSPDDLLSALKGYAKARHNRSAGH